MIYNNMIFILQKMECLCLVLKIDIIQSAVESRLWNDFYMNDKYANLLSNINIKWAFTFSSLLLLSYNKYTFPNAPCPNVYPNS